MRRWQFTSAMAIMWCTVSPLAVSSADAARLCKDGYVIYAGSTSAPSRRAAEASAETAWRAERPLRHSDTANRPTSPRMKCVRGGSPVAWRCFIREGRCGLA